MTTGTLYVIPAELQSAINTTKDACRRQPHALNLQIALAYLDAIPQAVLEYGIPGLQTQLLYVLNNLNGWRGDEARAVKKTLKQFTKKKIESFRA